MTAPFTLEEINDLEVETLARKLSKEPAPSPSAVPPRETPPRRMQSYYFGFDATGESAIDGVLQAVRDSGKRFHHTEGWTDDASGESCEEAIQNAADEGAREIVELRRLAAPLAPEAVALLEAGYEEAVEIAARTNGRNCTPRSGHALVDAGAMWHLAGRPGLPK